MNSDQPREIEWCRRNNLNAMPAVRPTDFASALFNFVVVGAD